ncbi:MAG: hypothetical protein IJ808_06645 [Muribaculaceae bacterium]|nr:hypothetical protein [Muribaculaceae bacterium]
MELLKNIILVIIAPKVGWEDVNMSGISTQRLLQQAFYPLLAVLAITSFFPMVYDSTLTVSMSLVRAIIKFSAFFFSYFIVHYLLAGFYPELVKTKGAITRLDDYILYPLIYLVLLGIIENVLPIDFTPIFFLMLYLAWICYRGADYMGLVGEKKTKFIIISTALLIFVPATIKYLLGIVIAK